MLLKFISKRSINVITLLIYLMISPAYARLPSIEVKEAGGYKIEKKTDLAVLAEDLKNRNLTVVTFSLVGPDGKKIMDIDPVNFRGSMPIKLCKDELFWVTYKPTQANPFSGPETIHIYDIKTKVKSTLDQAPWPFNMSPNCRKIVYSDVEQNLVLFDRDKKTNVKFTKLGNGGRDDGFTPLSWSSDGSKFWFGSGVVESYSKIGYYQDGKVTWIPLQITDDDTSIEPDRAWLAHSDDPQIIDAVDRKSYEASGKITTLKVIDLNTGKETIIDKAKTNRFDPTWNSEKELSYKIHGKLKSISYKDLEKQLAASKISEAFSKNESK